MTTMTNTSELKRCAERRVNLLTQIADLQEDVKMLKVEDKANGYNEKALAQCVKELLGGSEYQADQLQFEMELDTYRTAVGLPVTLETAHRHVRNNVLQDKMTAADATLADAIAGIGGKVSVSLTPVADVPPKSPKKPKENAA